MTISTLVLAAAAALALAACRGEASCLSGEDGCRVPSPCVALAYGCPGGGSVRVRRVADGRLPFSGPDVAGVGQDVVLENDRIAVVIDALDAPHMLAPTGGTIIDLAPVGGADQLNQIYTVTSVLPDDAFHYRELEIVDESPRLVAVLARGTLDGRPEVKVATRYELRPCEPGVRVRSELYNGTADPFAFAMLAVSYWGGKQPIPFVPVAGRGFTQPELDLGDVDPSWGSYPLVAARSTSGPDVSYAFLSCDRAELEGVNDVGLTGIGTARRLVRPGEGLAMEQLWVTAGGAGVEGALALAVDARRRLGRAPAPIVVTGSVLAGGAPLGGDEAHASILVQQLRGGAVRPVTEAIPAADGRFAATLPEPGHYRFELWSFGRVVASDEREVAADGSIGELLAPAPAELRVHMAEGADAQITVLPADEATRTAVAGTQHGQNGGCAPWLGPPHGASPACNRVLLRGEGSFDLPAGHYLVYASHGPFWTLARAEVTLAAGERRSLPLAIRPLPGLADGVVSADLHVHGRRSFDSSIPDEDRVLSFAVAGVQVIAATDHDVVGEYEQAVADLGLERALRVLPGVETSGQIPFLDVEGEDIPRVIGHFNFLPVLLDRGAPRNGAPWDELVEPGELFDRMDRVLAPGGVRMLNHPWDDPDQGRDLGYLRAAKFDPRVAIPAVDDCSDNGMLARRPAGGHGNLDVHLVEVMNGHHLGKAMKYRRIWWSLLDQGYVFAGAANTDSHSLSDAQIGWPRNLLRARGAIEAFDEQAFLADLRAGRMSGSNGPVIDAYLVGEGGGAPLRPELLAARPPPGARLHVTVSAAPWIPVSEIRVVVNGQVMRTVAGLATPADPLGLGGLVRHDGELALDELLPGDGSDAWLLVEAGLPLPLAADLDDDGVLDTGDNDGDGRVDARDVEPGEDSGPLGSPADPDPWSDDPRVLLTAVEPGTWPFAFTNPFLLDIDGDGAWEAPGP